MSRLGVKNIFCRLSSNKSNFDIVKSFWKFQQNHFFSKSSMKEKIKEKSLLNNNKEIKISYYSKIQVCKDSYVFRFLLPDSDSYTGLKVCQYVYLEALIPNLPGETKVIKRAFNPISLDTDKGFIDIMIKVYSIEPGDLNYGIFSNYLATLEEGQVLKMSGPHGHIEYEGKGEFTLRTKEGIQTKKVNKIGMIAGGTGITPIFQLIQKIISTRDRTGVSLIYCTKFIEDLAFCEDLVKYDRSGKLGFYPVVETPTASKWLYGIGKVTEEMIINYMPSHKDDDSAIFLCGPKLMIDDHLKPMLRSMNYKEENILSFH